MRTFYSRTPCFLTVRDADGAVTSRFVEAGQPIVVPDDHKPSTTWIPEEAWLPAAPPQAIQDADTLAGRQAAEAAFAATQQPPPVQTAPKAKRASDRDAI